MIAKFVVYTAGAGLGFFLAGRFVPGVEFAGTVWDFLAAGAIFALLDTLVAPIVKLITFPLRVLTLNLFSLVIDMAMVWIVDVFIVSLRIHGLIALFWTTLIVWSINLILWKILSPSFKSSSRVF